MPIHFRCDECQSPLSISRRKVGENISCPKCDYPLTVPEQTDSSLAGRSKKSSPSVLVAQPFIPVGDAAPTENIKPLRRFQPRGWLFIACAVAILCAAVSILWFSNARAGASLPEETIVKNLPSPNPPPVPAPPEQKKPAPPEEKGILLPQLVVVLPSAQATPGMVKAPGNMKKFQYIPVGMSVAKSGPRVDATISNTKTPLVQGKLAVRYRKMAGTASEKDLRWKLTQVPKVSLNIDADMRRKIINLTRLREQEADGDFNGPMIPTSQKQVLVGLPMSKGPQCRLDKVEATRFFKSVSRIRTSMSTMTNDQFLGGPDVQTVREKLGEHKLDSAEFRACVQMLQVEDQPYRQYLVEQLISTKGAKASKVLAQRAIFDLSPEVREMALRALKKRPVSEYSDVLLHYLNYPWPTAAEHAARALVEVDAKSVIPELVHKLKEPDVTQPRPINQGGRIMQAVPQLVRINHLQNCLLCHPSTLSRGGIRGSGNPNLIARIPVGAVPTPGQRVPPAASTQYYQSGDLFVRADVTYLKQDFSILQPVEKHGAWPEKQRFDFVVRMLPLTDEQAKGLQQLYHQEGVSPQRRAHLYALRRLTGLDLGNNYDGWKLIVTASAR